MARSSLRRMGVWALAALLLAGAMPLDSHAAMIGVEAVDGAAMSRPGESNAQALDRTPAAPKLDLAIGGLDAPFDLPPLLATGREEADTLRGPASDPSFVQDAWEKAFTQTLRVPPSKVYAPIQPPSRLLRMLIG